MRNLGFQNSKTQCHDLNVTCISDTIIRMFEVHLLFMNTEHKHTCLSELENGIIRMHIDR